MPQTGKQAGIHKIYEGSDGMDSMKWCGVYNGWMDGCKDSELKDLP